MAHNYQKIGGRYFGKAILSGNTGTADLPYRDVGLRGFLQAVAQDPLQSEANIFGTGIYLIDNPNFQLGNKGVLLEGDGYAVIKGNGANLSTLLKMEPTTTTGHLVLRNLILEDLNIDFGFFANLNCPVTISQCIWRRCTIKGYHRNGAKTISDCLFVDCSHIEFGNTNNANSHIIQTERCYFINSTVIPRGNTGSGTQVNFDYCYFDETSTIDFTNATVNGRIRYSNIRTGATIIGTPTLLENINSDPQFNNSIVLDFTLRKTSPHLAKRIGPSWLRLASGFYFKGLTGDISANSGHYFENIATGAQHPVYFAENLTATFQEGYLRMRVKEAVGGQLTGKFRCLVKVSDVPVEITRVDFVAGINFNTDFPATESSFDPNNPTILNNNVPNAFNYVSGHEGRNPNRLDYSYRWSAKPEPDLNLASDWQTAAVRPIFEWGTVSKYNPVTGTGNADPGYEVNPADINDMPRSIICTYMDVEGAVMNNYYSA